MADLRLSARPGNGLQPDGRPAPLVIFLHGGFWRAAYGRAHTGPLAESLAADGYAVCAPEFRRTGQPGGGWPGTFDDIAAAVDTLPGLVAEGGTAARSTPAAWCWPGTPQVGTWPCGRPAGTGFLTARPGHYLSSRPFRVWWRSARSPPFPPAIR